MADNTSTKFQVGQVWSYKTRLHETSSTLTVVKIDPGPDGTEDIISIHIAGLRLLSRNGQHLNHFQHLPIGKSALEESVLELLQESASLPNHKEGYDTWRKAFDSGKAGWFTIPVSECLQGVEVITAKQETEE